VRLHRLAWSFLASPCSKSWTTPSSVVTLYIEFPPYSCDLLKVLFASVFKISCLTQFSKPPFATISCKFFENSPTFSSQRSPFFPSCTLTTLRVTSHVRVHPVRRVGNLSEEVKVARRRSMRRGTSKPKSALLMLFREKMFPKLP